MKANMSDEAGGQVPVNPGRSSLTWAGVILAVGSAVIGIGVYSSVLATYTLLTTGHLQDSLLVLAMFFFIGIILAMPIVVVAGGVLGWVSSVNRVRADTRAIQWLGIVTALASMAVIFALGYTGVLCGQNLSRCFAEPGATIEYELRTNRDLIQMYVPQLLLASFISILCGLFVGKRLIAWK